MASTVLNIIRGSDKDFTVLVTIIGGCNSGEPFDLTGASEIKALFKKEDDTILTKTLSGSAITIVSATTGKIKVLLTDADTSLLAVGDGQPFEIEIIIGTITSIVQFIETLNVRDRVFA